MASDNCGRLGWFSLFSIAAAAPLVVTKFAIDYASDLFSMKKILAAISEIEIVADNVPAVAQFYNDTPAFPVILAHVDIPMSSLAQSIIPDYLTKELPAYIATVCETAAWLVGGYFACKLAGNVAYKWYYSKPSTSCEDRNDKSDDDSYEDIEPIDMERASQRQSTRRCFSC